MSSGPTDDADFLRTARAGLILHLRQNGITDRALLGLFEAVPHEHFVPEDYAEYAYGEASLPIACGQSITSPLILARLFSALDPVGAGKILEVGTGSGYASALLAHAGRRVFSIDRFAQLAREAQARWKALDLSNIVGFHADGLLGLTQQAPFARILLTGAVETVPEALIAQIDDRGILVAPVGAANQPQKITRMIRVGEGVELSEHGQVRLPPLVPAKAGAL